MLDAPLGQGPADDSDDSFETGLSLPLPGVRGYSLGLCFHSRQICMLHTMAYIHRHRFQITSSACRLMMTMQLHSESAYSLNSVRPPVLRLWQLSLKVSQSRRLSRLLLLP